MISSELNLNRFTVHQILTQELYMRNLCAKVVPKNSRLSRRPIGGMFSSVQSSLFRSIKHITSLKDLLDIEQVIVLYMYKHIF